MANITKRNNAYRIRVSCGYDAEGKQRTSEMSWAIPPGMSEKRAEKEVHRVAVLFEEECRGGITHSSTKFATFLEQWFAECGNSKLKARTLNKYKRLSKRANDELGHLKLNKITTRDIQRYIDKLNNTELPNRYGATLSPKTVTDYAAFVSTVLSYAVKLQLISRNPCEYVTLPRKVKPEREMLTLEQAKALLRILTRGDYDGSEGRNHNMFLILALYTGMRRGEISGLMWKDIDLERGLISIRRATNFESGGRGAYVDTPKTEQSVRTLKIAGQALSELLAYKEWQASYAASIGDKWNDNGWVFTNWCGDLMYLNGPGRYLKKLCEENDLPHVKLHSLRHLNASLLIYAGLDIKTVQAALGHSEASTTLNTYAHEFQMAYAAASVAVTNSLEAVLAG